MSEYAPKRLSDGSVSFEAGVDTGRSPNLIERNQVVWAINTTMQGAICATRPGWKKLPFSLADGCPVDGVFQCCGGYVNAEGHKFLVFLVSGRVYVWDKISKIATDITIPGDPNPSIFLNGWMVQAENYLIIQDGFSQPLIFDGSTLRRAAGNEIKTGTVMAYVQGRIWYALPDGFSFRATDLVYSDGTAAAVLRETENTFLNEGGDFSVGSDSGGITGIGVPAVLATAFATGPLLVMTPKYVYVIQAPVDRTIWKNLNYPIESIGLVNYGAVAARSCVTVNGDVYYRAPDGIRSFYFGMRMFNSPGNVPISNELNFLLQDDDPQWLGYSSGITFQNRLLTTASPRFSRLGVLHRAMTALNFNLLSGMRQKLPPAWEGMWTGVDIHQLVKVEWAGQENAYIISREADKSIGIWEITRDDPFDSPGPGRQTPIQWEFWTKAYDWNQPQFLKRLDSAELWVEQVLGNVDFSVQFKPDQYPGWVCWNTWSECATIQNCSSLTNPAVQYRPKMRLPTPTEASDPVIGVPYRNVFEAQMRVAVTGHAWVKRLRMNAYEIQEQVVGECRTDAPCTTLDRDCSTSTSGCTTLGVDLFAYRSNP
jgi:hypothetical protein